MPKAFQYISDLIVHQSGIDERLIVPEAGFKTDLGLDSLDITELVMLYEDENNVEIADERIKTLITVSDLIQLHKEYSDGKV